jgi:hypothetical protein
MRLHMILDTLTTRPEERLNDKLTHAFERQNVEIKQAFERLLDRLKEHVISGSADKLAEEPHDAPKIYNELSKRLQ